MNETHTYQWIDSLIEAFHIRMEEDEDGCPCCIADQMTNENTTAMLADAYAAGKDNPSELINYLAHKRAVLKGMQQIIEDCLVSTFEVFEGELTEDMQSD
jgi:uncharacterized protein CbrC (UPF0167 family)